MASSTFKCIDAHTCGNPVRLIVDGAPELQGESIAEKREDFMTRFDWIRQGLMFEPRGHDMMSGAIFYPAANKENDIGLLFIETSGCLPMCGHGTIGAITIGIERNLITPKQPGKVNLETPAGLVKVEYEERDGKVTSVKFINVPSFVIAENLDIECRKLGKLKIDVAFGGNFYAIVDIQENYPGLENFSASELIDMGRELRFSINENFPSQFVHPLNNSINGLSHILWTGVPTKKAYTARNAVFYGDKAIDRSPCGTGTSARMAQWYAKGKLKLGEPFFHESLLGSVFEGRVESETQIGALNAIIPSIRGWAKIYGENSITIDEDDPYAFGFQII